MDQIKKVIIARLAAVVLTGVLPAQAITAITTGARTNTYDYSMRVYSHDTACDSRGSQARWTQNSSPNIHEWNNGQGCNTGTYTTSGGTKFAAAQACTTAPLTRSRCGNWSP